MRDVHFPLASVQELLQGSIEASVTEVETNEIWGFLHAQGGLVAVMIGLRLVLIDLP